jgi:4'-phosphopantetheinyl transferase
MCEVSCNDEGRCGWVFNIDEWQPTETEWHDALQCVSIDEQARILRLRRPTEKGVFEGRNNPNAKASLVGLLLIRELCHKILELPYHEIIIARTREGKPYLHPSVMHRCMKKSFAFFNFNISHAGHYVVCVTEPQWLVGVDVMRHTTPPTRTNIAEFFDNLSSCFTAKEWTVIRQPHYSSHEQLLFFYIFWTLKEAYAKALGIGLGLDFHRIQFTLTESDTENKEQNPHNEVQQHQRLQQRPSSATIEVDGKQCEDWRFDIYYWKDHIISVAYGPPNDAIDSFKKNVLAMCSRDSNESLRQSTERSLAKLRRLQWRQVTPHDLNIDFASGEK